MEPFLKTSDLFGDAVPARDAETLLVARLTGAAGAGLPAFHSPPGVGTDAASGEEKRASGSRLPTAAE